MPTQTVNWKGKLLEVEYEVMRAEPDVGLMTDYPELLSIMVVADGKELPPITSQQEDEILNLIILGDD